MKRIAVLASGRGSNFQAILDALSVGKINGEIVALLTDNRDAYAIQRADTAGIPAIVLNYKDYHLKSGV